jgi:hypothetical protein
VATSVNPAWTSVTSMRFDHNPTETFTVTSHDYYPPH